jgi:hypothetical protein
MEGIGGVLVAVLGVGARGGQQLRAVLLEGVGGAGEGTATDGAVRRLRARVGILAVREGRSVFTWQRHYRHDGIRSPVRCCSGVTGGTEPVAAIVEQEV